MTKIKICGLKRTEDISYVNELLPDFAGFVFAKSSRQVDAKKTAELKKQLSPKIKAVGVFVNAEPEFIDKLYQKQIIDLAQLHGDETADYIHRLKNLCPSLPLIKAVRVQSTKRSWRQKSFHAIICCSIPGRRILTAEAAKHLTVP